MTSSEPVKRFNTPHQMSFDTASSYERVQSMLVAVLNTHVNNYKLSNMVPSSAELDVLNVQLTELLDLHALFGKEARNQRARRAVQMASKSAKHQSPPEGTKNEGAYKGHDTDIPHQQMHSNTIHEGSSDKLEEAKNLLAGILKRELNLPLSGVKGNALEQHLSQESSMSGSSRIHQDGPSNERDAIVHHHVTNLLAQAVRKGPQSDNPLMRVQLRGQTEEPTNVALSSVVQQIKDVLQNEAANDAHLKDSLASTMDSSRKRKDRTDDEAAVRALMALNDTDNL